MIKVPFKTNNSFNSTMMASFRGGLRPGSQGSGTLSAFFFKSNYRVRDLKTVELIDFLEGLEPVLMTGFQNKTDSL